MIKSYLKIILRNVRKHPGYSIINIAGLTCGITCCLMIWLFVQDELSYDRYHEKAKQIYRVAWKRLAGNNELKLPFIPAPLAEIMVNEYPEVIQAVRFFNFGNYLIRYKDNRFIEDRFYLADSTVFETFTIPFIQGDPKTALVQPNSIVITQEMAETYFGVEDPLGKSLTLQDKSDLHVTGVIENLPQNTHFHFNFLAPISLNPVEALRYE